MNNRKPRPIISPMIVLLIGVFSVSTASIFIRFAQEEAPSLVIAASRLTLAVLILAPFTLKSRKSEIRELNFSTISVMALSGILLAIHFASWITSLEMTTVASSVTIVATIPLWVAALSSLLLKEKLKPLVIMGLIIALVGGSIVTLSKTCVFSTTSIILCPDLFRGTQDISIQGNILALIGAWSGAGYFLIGKIIRSKISNTTYIFFVYGTAALLLLSFVLFTGAQIFFFSPIIYVYFICLAIFPQLLGHSSYNWCLKYLSATYVSIALLGEPIGSIILAYIILHETPHLFEYVGGAVILLGIFLASRAEQDPGQQS